MLAVPIGMSRSVETHNINFNAFCDWIEGSVLFHQTEISGSDIVDVLLEEDIYAKQDLAWDIVDNAWREIERRQTWMGNDAAILCGRHLSPVAPWTEKPALTFCLALSFMKWYPRWAAALGPDFNEQGHIFEELVKESLQAILSDWEIYHTGWNRTAPLNLNTIVTEVTARLGEIGGNLEPWTTAKANDAGLDLLCYRPFMDSRVGVPVLMMQCASGANWVDKLHTPNLNIWMKLVGFAVKPKKAFSTPYALSEKEFMSSSNAANAIFLDRYRLLSPGRENVNWLSGVLRDRILAWAEPRVNLLPGIG